MNQKKLIFPTIDKAYELGRANGADMVDEDILWVESESLLPLGTPEGRSGVEEDTSYKAILGRGSQKGRHGGDAYMTISAGLEGFREPAGGMRRKRD